MGGPGFVGYGALSRAPPDLKSPITSLLCFIVALDTWCFLTGDYPLSTLTPMCVRERVSVSPPSPPTPPTHPPTHSFFLCLVHFFLSHSQHPCLPLETSKRSMDVRKAASPAPGFSGRMATLNQIMLKFRPIAPKPPTVESVSDSMSASGDSNTPPLTKRNRPKRKYVRVNSKRNNSSNNKNSSTGSGSNRKGRTGKEDEDEKRDLQSDGTVVSSDFTGPTVSRDIGSSINITAFVLPTNWGKFGSNDNFGPGLEDQSDRGVGLESWVVVNGMTTETLLDVGELGSTDREKIRNLEMDTCPGLISDGLYRVQWMNLAYRKMVESVGSGEPPGKAVVWLVLEENVPEGWPVFGCTVKVVYTWRKEKHSKTMPCDVWKMDFGGFAWRLDAKAELCLGR